MLPKNIEEQAYRAVEMGEIEIDAKGRIWRIAARRGDRCKGGTRVIPCIRRRAEKRVTGGYLQIRVMIDWKRAHALAHRLVWRHLHGPIPAGLTINHKNGQRDDNRPENLELASYAEQTQHQIEVLGHDPRTNLAQYHG